MTQFYKKRQSSYLSMSSKTRNFSSSITFLSPWRVLDLPFGRVDLISFRHSPFASSLFLFTFNMKHEKANDTLKHQPRGLQYPTRPESRFVGALYCRGGFASLGDANPRMQITRRGPTAMPC